MRRERCKDSVAEWSKAIDLKSIILWMRRFKSCHCRFFVQKMESRMRLINKSLSKGVVRIEENRDRI